MTEFSMMCDVYQGYNYRKDKQTPVGFITKLKLGDQDLAADQTCKDPTNPETDLSVVAVLSGINWGIGVTDTLYFAGQVSTANKQSVKTLLYKSLTKVDAVFQVTVYDYDPIAKTYFKCFHCGDTDMDGLLEKSGDADLNLAVADIASGEVQSPENYAMSLGIVPQPAAQVITIATGSQANIAKAWGLAVS